MKCFYHRIDFDGVCSAAIVKAKYPECELIGIDYGDDGNYVGDVSNGFPHGYGTFTWPGGGEYVGEFRDGKRQEIPTRTIH